MLASTTAPRISPTVVGGSWRYIEGRVEAAAREILKDRSAIAGAALSAGVSEGDLSKVLGRDWFAIMA